MRPMRIGYLDCASGASGDMLLGALLDAGWPEARLREVASGLGVPVRIHTSRAERRGVPALRVEVQEEDPPSARPYPRLAEILAGSRIEEPVRSAAAALLRRLAEVEAEVHTAPIERVHLHELGGLDTLVDLVGVLSGVRDLGIERLAASPVNLGRGRVRTGHGTGPVPAPATLAFLEGMSVYAGEVEGELLTPTGAALLSRLVTRWGPLPPMRLAGIGTGAGRADFPRANVLRLFVGEALEELPPAEWPARSLAEAIGQAGGPAGGAGRPSPRGASERTGASRTERLVMLETSIDDMNPQVYPHVTDRLLASGALDVTIVPALMKKGRPGHLVRVLTPPERARALSMILMSETTTIGVRAYEVTRLAVDREIAEVATEFGLVPVKVAREPGGILNLSPEFDACRALAERHRVPVKQVIAAAQRAAAALFEMARRPPAPPSRP